MTIDLLVVNYNTPKLLKRFLDVLHSDYEPDVWKLYLADNGSTDDSQEWIMENAASYNIEEVIFNENIGYAKAINDLAFRSNSEILCALNSDVWFPTNHVKEVAQSFNELPNVGVLGVKQMDEEFRVRHGGIFWDRVSNPSHRAWTQYDPGDRLCKDAQRCWTVSGSIYYVKRSVWNEITNHPKYRELYPDAKGAFLPTPHYFEETFCSQMTHHLGHDVWYDGRVQTAGHTWHASNSVGDNNDKFAYSRQLYIAACNYIGIPHECN